MDALRRSAITAASQAFSRCWKKMGIEIAARIPRITITTSNSISVKP